MAVKLDITLNDDGSVTVNGPLANKIICYGLLEAAKIVVKDWEPKDAPRILRPDFIPPADLKPEG